jgi:hypothetical protein
VETYGHGIWAIFAGTLAAWIILPFSLAWWFLKKSEVP